MRPLTPDRYRLYLQAMPRLLLISGPIAIALHFYLGPSLKLSLITLISFIVGVSQTNNLSKRRDL
jgi:hypothetical protein